MPTETPKYLPITGTTTCHWALPRLAATPMRDLADFIQDMMHSWGSYFEAFYLRNLVASSKNGRFVVELSAIICDILFICLVFLQIMHSFSFHFSTCHTAYNLHRSWETRKKGGVEQQKLAGSTRWVYRGLMKHQKRIRVSPRRGVESTWLDS